MRATGGQSRDPAARARTARARARRAIAVLAAVLLGALVACLQPGAAAADIFGPISLVSEGAVNVGTPQQAEYAHDPAISEDGRYVAFDGAIGGVTGVWRRDLATGAIEQVAGGDAELPSISEDGRYVSFTTNEGASLAAITDGKPHEPRREAVNVYVRDMSKKPEEKEAFKVASAVDGSEQPLAYSGAGTARGAAALGRSAISADGNEVAFVTTAVSDLTAGTPVEPKTPRLQVAVRYLDTLQTKLVSVNRETGGPVSASEASETLGAVYAGRTSSFTTPPAYGEWGNSFPPGAAISADGSTVAWMGQNIAQQAQMLPDEVRNPRYSEPLWRRIQPGSETPTERVTGGSDPTNPACAQSGETALPPSPSAADPCQGPFDLAEEQPLVSGVWNSNGETGDFAPRLSADGYTVAFLSDVPLISAGENFGRFAQGQPSDLYVANMRAGLTRDQALTRLTELGGGEGDPAATEPIYDFDISPDGSQVAFATRRTQFPLGSPAYVSPQAGEPGMNELFDADLRDDTLTRVTHGYQAPDEASEHAHTPPRSVGEDPYLQHGDGALSPSFAAGGNLLAFSSTASNLVFGDGNAPPAGPLDGSDAFLVERETFVSLPTPQYVSPAPEALTEPAWRLGVSARSRPDGSVLLYVTAPGAGTLGAHAGSQVRLGSSTGRASRHARRASRHSRRGHAGSARVITGSARGVGGSARVVTRTVSSGGAHAQSEGLTTLTLKLAPAYSSLAGARGGLSAIVTVTFTATGHPPLHQSLDVTFLRAIHRARGSRRGAAADRRGARR